MAKKSKLLRKWYSILSIVLALSVILCMFAMPMSVSAAEGKAPTLIVAEDTFDTLSGWEHTDGVASATDGKLALKTGVDSANGTDGFIANVITRPETALNQSVTVEVSCDDLAAGKLPAIWLRVQDNGTSQKGYVFLATLSGTRMDFGLWWLDTSNANSRKYIVAHRSIGTSYFTGTGGGAGDTMVLTFSAVGSDPTVITMTSEFVNADWAITTTYEDTTADFQVAGKVGLSAKSASADNTMAFDNFVYKSDKIDAVVTDDFSPQTATSLKPEWVTYPSAENFSIVDNKLALTVDTGVPTQGYEYRVERPASENGINQTVSISFTSDQIDGGKMPILWLRATTGENGSPIGYYMMWNGSSGINVTAVLPDGTSQTVVSQYRSRVGWADKFVYTFSVIDDGDVTNVSASVNHIDTTGDNNYGSWTAPLTGSATIPSLQRAGAVAISGFEYGGTAETDTLIVDDFVYTTDNLTVTDDFGVGLGKGWTGYPNESYFSRADDVMTVLANTEIVSDRKLQRPMGEAAVDQYATITTSPATQFTSKMAGTALWLRVQNEEAGAPVGYYAYYYGEKLYIGKATSDGTNTTLTTTNWSYSNGIKNGTYVSLKAHFWATSNGDGSTTLRFRIDPIQADGSVYTSMVKEITATDSTAELQNAGTVAVTAKQSQWNVTEQNISFDDFRYEYSKITDETENVIDVRSLVRLKNYIAGYQGSIGAFADYNADGRINSEDLVTVIKHLLGVQLIGGELVTTELLTGAASAASATLKAEITNLSDTVKATGKTYYVSNDGNDNNWGTLKSFPIKTVEKVNELTLEEGDVVLFKRGDVFRTSEMIDVVSGVGYGAYGEGDKPVIMGSLKNYADESIWTSDENRDLWQVSVDAELVGNIVFNEGKAFGQFKNALSDVKHNGDYYFDAANKTLYLYYTDKNPGKVFDSIEIATTETIFRLPSVRENVTIENIAIKNTAKFGISALHRVSNIVIRGCEIGFIGGGKREEDGAHLGNGIEFWNNASNCLVENNYLYEIYDAALTFQGAGTYGGFTDITYNKNLVENSSMNFEFWLSPKTDDREYFAEPVIKNINFTNNIMRFGGNGFGSKVRPTKESFAFLLARDNEIDSTKFENFNVTGNTFDCTRDSFVYATKVMSMMNIDANTYYQAPISSSQVVRGTGLYANNANELFAAVTTVDKNPIEVAWVNADGTIETPTIISTTEDSADDPWN